MALQHHDGKTSVEEYFKLRESDPYHRYEYIDGEVHMMTGGSVQYSRAALNLSCLVESLLRNDSPCIVYTSDVCFQLAEDCYVYSDVTVSCDQRDSDENSEEENLKAIQFPCFVAEVLSPGTTARDRGIKAALYQEHSTPQEFLLLETKASKAQFYRRESDNRCTIYLLNAGDKIESTSLDVRCPLIDLYWKTRFSRRETR